MPIPERGLHLAQLQKCDGTPLPHSSHDVKRIQFEDKNHKIRYGYFKSCDKTYPPELAHYVTMFSVHIRMAIGNRAPEELPIYNENDVLMGTVSIDIPGFKPMLSDGEPGPESPAEFKLVCPDAASLVENKIAEVLMARLIRQEDDLHPGNLGLAGGIDLDMLWWRDISSRLKGLRYVSASGIVAHPADAFDLPASDLDTNFPCPIKTKPYYWPTHPKNAFTKSFRNVDDFRELNNPTFGGYQHFQRQKYLALLKELLMYDEVVLKERLSLYSNDEPFIRHCLSFFGEKQKELYQKVINDMPGFKDFIRNFVNLEAVLYWFAKDNHAQDVPNAPHSLEKVKSRFLGIWKDCHVQLFSDVLKNIDTLAEAYKPKLILTSFISKECLDDDFIQIDTTRRLSAAAEPSAPIIDNEPLLSKICYFNSQLQSLFASFFNHTDSDDEDEEDVAFGHASGKSSECIFYKDSTITIAHFQALLPALDHLLMEARLPSDSDSKASPALREKWEAALNALQEATKKILLPPELCELYSTDDMSSLLSSSMSSSIRTIENPDLVSIDKPQEKSRPYLVDCAIDIFYKWLHRQPPAAFRDNVSEAFKKYQPSFSDYRLLSWMNPMAYVRTRGEEVTKTLKKLDELAAKTTQSAEMTLPVWEEITSTGKWYETSFNVKLMRELCQRITYDSSDPLSKMKNFGDHKQFSSFLASLTPEELQTIRTRVLDLWNLDKVDENEDFPVAWLTAEPMDSPSASPAMFHQLRDTAPRPMP